MEQIILNTNLGLLISELTTEEKGTLLDALFTKTETNLSPKTLSLYRYISKEQEETAAKRQRLREIGAKGGSTPRRKNDTNTDKAPLTKRKEAKENLNFKKNNNNFLFKENSKEKVEALLGFTPPSIEEVKTFITHEDLNVDPEIFLDFYESRGWQVGQTKIKNWQAIARLWHRRAADKPLKSDDDRYWKELSARLDQSSPPAPSPTSSAALTITHHPEPEQCASPCKQSFFLNEENKENISPSYSPTTRFARFMHRIEKENHPDTPAETDTNTTQS